MREAVEARRRRARGARRGAAWRLAPRLAFAGGLAIVAAVVAVVLIGGPGGPTVAEAAELADRPASGPPPAPSGDSGTQLALDVEGVVFPDFARSFGWQPVGIRRDELDGRGATTVFYEKGTRRIAYVILAGPALHRRNLPPMEDVRSLAPLWPLRQRRNAVVVCLDDPTEYERARPELARLNAELVVERTPGPLSRALGRPSITVADRFGSVGLHESTAAVEQILRELEGFELACPECGPQAWGDPGS